MRVFLFAALLMLVPRAEAQEKITENILALTDSTAFAGVGLEAFDFLVGSWAGEGLGGQVQELWAPALGGSMNGLFRLVHGDELVLSEHMAVDTLDGRPVMRVKHFSPEFDGWEEKDESVAFPLVKAEPGAVYMAGLTIRMERPDELTYYLLMGSADGSQKEEVLRYKRVD